MGETARVSTSEGSKGGISKTTGDGGEALTSADGKDKRISGLHVKNLVERMEVSDGLRGRIDGVQRGWAGSVGREREGG